MNDSFCYKTAKIWQLIGYVVLVLKIVIPIIIIILGIIDMSKAVISSDDRAIRTNGIALLKRVAAGLLILVTPTLVKTIFEFLQNYTKLDGDYLVCVDCVTSPNNACDVSYEPEILE